MNILYLLIGIAIGIIITLIFVLHIVKTGSTERANKIDRANELSLDALRERNEISRAAIRSSNNSAIVIYGSLERIEKIHHLNQPQHRITRQ